MKEDFENEHPFYATTIITMILLFVAVFILIALTIIVAAIAIPLYLLYLGIKSGSIIIGFIALITALLLWFS